MQHRFIGVIGRKDCTQFLRMLDGFFRVGKEQIIVFDKRTEKDLQRAISLIVRHEPHPNACAVLHRFSDETFPRNCVGSVHANAAET